MNNPRRTPPPAPPQTPSPGEEHESLADRFRGWRLGLNMDGELIAKGAVCALLIVFFSLVQTTLFTRFRPFGAVPDLILPLVIAVSMTEREKWGAVCGLIGAFVIESLGGSPLTLLPLLYMPAGYVCGLLTIHYFRDSAAVRLLYTAVSSLARAVFTLTAFGITAADIPFTSLLTGAVLPEFAANLIFAALPHVIVWLALSPFNKSRDAKVQ